MKNIERNNILDITWTLILTSLKYNIRTFMKLDSTTDPDLDYKPLQGIILRTKGLPGQITCVGARKIERRRRI